MWTDVRSEIVKVSIPGGGRWVIVRDGRGMGGFGDPPGVAERASAELESTPTNALES